MNTPFLKSSRVLLLLTSVLAMNCAGKTGSTNSSSETSVARVDYATDFVHEVTKSSPAKIYFNAGMMIPLDITNEKYTIKITQALFSEVHTVYLADEATLLAAVDKIKSSPNGQYFLKSGGEFGQDDQGRYFLSSTWQKPAQARTIDLESPGVGRFVTFESLSFKEKGLSAPCALSIYYQVDHTGVFQELRTYFVDSKEDLERLVKVFQLYPWRVSILFQGRTKEGKYQLNIREKLVTAGEKSEFSNLIFLPDEQEITIAPYTEL